VMGSGSGVAVGGTRVAVGGTSVGAGLVAVGFGGTAVAVGCGAAHPKRLAINMMVITRVISLEWVLILYLLLSPLDCIVTFGKTMFRFNISQFARPFFSVPYERTTFFILL
jgi:hypothetical protein